MNTVFLENTIANYLITAGIILFVLIASKIISRLVARLFCKVVGSNWKNIDQQSFVELVLFPLSTFLTVLISIIALYRLKFPTVLNVTIYKYTAAHIIQTTGTIIIICCFIWLLLRIIEFIASILEKRAMATADHSENQLILFFKDFLKVLIGIIGLLMILRFAFNYNIGTLLTGLSIVGAAIALALRESLENLIASFVIFFDKPFTTGDLVRVQNITGNVERIGLRSTRIRTEQKTYVTVPNKQMVDSILDNLSLRLERKNDLLLNINRQTPSEKIEAAMAEIQSFLSKEKDLSEYNVLLNDINIHGIILLISFSTPPVSIERFNAIKQEVNLYAIQTLERLEIKQ
jgi:MscS family membrane protein